MAKINKEEQARREGMAYALNIAKTKGIEALEEELRFRNALQMPIAVPRKNVDEALNNIKMNILDTVTILSAVTLHDEFGFGKKRLKQYIDRFNMKTECLIGSYTNWDEQKEILKEECGLDCVIRREEDFK